MPTLLGPVADLVAELDPFKLKSHSIENARAGRDALRSRAARRARVRAKLAPLPDVIKDLAPDRGAAYLMIDVLVTEADTVD